MKTLYVTDKISGKKVRHGYFDNLSFIRHIQRQAIRWSDYAFTINSEFWRQTRKDMIELVKHVKFFKFHWDGYEYSIPRSVVDLCVHTSNEYGEDNVRIPIDLCTKRKL